MNCNGITKSGKRCRKKATKGDTCHLHIGSGIFKDAYNFVKRRVNAIREGPASKPSSKLDTFLNKNQNHIVKMQLGRKPILGPVHRALDVISFGRFSKKAKELNYDNIYHNYLLVTLDDGRIVKIEKNEIVSESAVKPGDFSGQLFDIPLGDKQLTMRNLIDNASKNDEANFYKYRAGSNNCQKFTADVITRNGLLPPEEQQNAAALIETLPGAAIIPNAITDAAAVANRLLTGDGIYANKLRRRKIIRCPL